MESGVLAAMLAGAQGTDIGSAAEIARDGSHKCRAVRLSQIGEGAFRPGEWRYRLLRCTL